LFEKSKSGYYFAEQPFYKDVEPLFEQDELALYHEVNENYCHKNVFDSYDGDLKVVQSLMAENRINFVYLYANWCARSKKYKPLILSLACKFSSKVTCSKSRKQINVFSISLLYNFTLD
jgi:thiol-disulfide isomerase/thioredoxin